MSKIAGLLPGAQVNTGKRLSSRESAASVRKWVESLHI